MEALAAFYHERGKVVYISDCSLYVHNEPDLNINGDVCCYNPERRVATFGGRTFLRKLPREGPILRR